MAVDDSVFPPGDPAAEAARWWMALQQAPDDEALKARMEAWADAAPAHRAALDRIARGWDAAGMVAADPRLMAMRAQALKARPTRRAPPRWLVAASAAGLVVIAAGAWLWRGAQPATELAAASPPSAPAVASTPPVTVQGGASSNLYRTAAGRRTAVVLPDGSVLRLEGGSEAVATFADGLRLATLRRGDATFEVAKDGRPFVVRAGGRRITAHGTVFRVRVSDHRFSVALLEGSIEVAREEAAPGERADWLRPGQELKVEAGAPAAIVPVPASGAPPVPGRLIFEDTLLATAVAEANRFGDVRILLEGPRAARLRVSGVFVAGQQQNIAQALSELYGLELTRTASGDLRLRATS